jgi:SAM-dependent methyltransferase
MNESNDIDCVEKNREIHDRISTEYESRHLEIFNAVEQNRLSLLLLKYIEETQSRVERPHFLDFGCGTGNITRILNRHNIQITSADISENSLNTLLSSIKVNQNVSTLLLNGNLVDSLFNQKFDAVVIYSVLHHLPDYISDLKSLSSCVNPKGYLILDHEVCPSFWTGSAVYCKYLQQLRNANPFRVRFISILRSMVNFQLLCWRIRTKLFKHRVPGPEGDIHVHPHDHVDWSAIHEILTAEFALVESTDYLVCRGSGEKKNIWDQFQNKCADMRYSVYQRLE